MAGPDLSGQEVEEMWAFANTVIDLRVSRNAEHFTG